MTISERVLSRWKTASDPRRPRWIPQDTPEIKPEGTDLVLYPHELGGRYGLIAFWGKQGKPFHNYTYGTRKNDRDKAMEELIKNNRAHHKRKEDERAEKKQFQTSLFFGDILYTSWGYDQTQVNFYEVVEVLGPKAIKVREVAARNVAGDDDPHLKLVPVPGKYVGPEMKVMVSTGDRAKIEGHGASKWNGKPLYQTGGGLGH